MNFNPTAKHTKDLMASFYIYFSYFCQVWFLKSILFLRLWKKIDLFSDETKTFPDDSDFFPLTLIWNQQFHQFTPTLSFLNIAPFLKLSYIATKCQKKCETELWNAQLQNPKWSKIVYFLLVLIYIGFIIENSTHQSDKNNKYLQCYRFQSCHLMMNILMQLILFCIFYSI